MGNQILNKYRNVKPVSDVKVVEDMLRVLVEMPRHAQRWINDRVVGALCYYEDERYPQYVLEYAMSNNQDSVTTLYMKTPEFESLESCRKMREDLISEIGRALMAIPSFVQVYDAGRERRAHLNELGTAQLIDTLAHFVGQDLATL